MRFWNSKENRAWTPDEFNAYCKEKYGKTDFSGQRLINSRDNADGDVAATSEGFQYATDRLTYIRSRYVEQTFYEIAPADYLNVIVGEGAFAQNIITNITFKSAGDFKQGKINTANMNSKVNLADAGVAPIQTYIQNWALGTEYTIFDVNQALFTGTWDPIESKQKARKKVFDLGIQELTFLGDVVDSNFPGLLTASNVTANTSRITAAISAYGTNVAGLTNFVAGILADYFSNCDYTAMPNKFLIPTDDWAGLGVPYSPTYPNISVIAYLKQTFDALVPNQKVELMPLAYGIPAKNKTVLNVGTGSHAYVLYHDDIDTLFMEIPVNYTVTQVGTYNNFQFQDVAYCQYSGVTVLKPLEILLMTF